MIKDETLDEAVTEAKRFLREVGKYKAAKNASPSIRMAACKRWSTVAEHAAVKRASLDLTRKLAEMRKGL